MIKFLIPMFLLFLSGCDVFKEEKKLTAADSIRIELLKQADSLGHLMEIKPVTYSLYKGKLSPKILIGEYGDSAAGMILALNRIDKSNLRKNDTLIVPDTIVLNWLYYSPFPLSINMAAEIPRILFISQGIQAFAAYEYGVLVKWGPVSTGKKNTPTPNGLFHTNWKAKETISTINDEWLLKWSFNIDNFNGISIHEYEMPGYPASHSCARLLSRDAEWLYYWAHQWIVTKDEEDVLAYGTPVIIFGEYDFQDRRPWRKLPDNPESNKISSFELRRILSPHISTILQRQTARIAVKETRDSLKKTVENDKL